MASTVKERSFPDAINDFLEGKEIVDFAFVGRRLNGELESLWVAGSGKDVVGDRERADYIAAELDRLKIDLLIRTLPHKTREQQG